MRVPAELSDQTFIAVPAAVLAAVVADPRRWVQWWPDLALQVTRDRGLKGQQWVLTGDVAGTAEIYLEPWHDGTVVHLFLRLQLPVAGRGSVRHPHRATTARTLAWKRTVTRLKDDLEADRRPGTDAVTGSSPAPDPTS